MPSSDWTRVPLGQILEQDKHYITALEDREYPKLSVKLYGRGCVLDEAVHSRDVRMKRHQLAKAEQVILSEIWGKKGAIGFVPLEGEGALVTSHFFLFDLDTTHITKDWLYWLFRANYFENELSGQARGTTGYAAVRPKQFLELKIPLPSRAEQQRIVARIDALAARIAEAQALQAQAVEEAEALFASVLNLYFEKVLVNYPLHQIQEVCKVIRGGSPRPADNPDYYGGDIPFIRIGDLTKDNGKYLYHVEKTLTEEGRKKSRFVPVGTLMLTQSGATLGVPKITKIAGCFNDACQAFLNLDAQVDAEYLYYFFQSKTRWLRESPARGQAQPNLNRDMIKPLRFPLPPLTEQKKIITELDNLSERMKAIKQLQEKSQAELDALLPSVLDKAFRGEL